MNCREVNFVLDARAPAELSAAERQSVELHFTSCQLCRDAWAAYREVTAQQPPRMSPDLRLRVATALAARAAGERRWPRRSLRLGGMLAVAGAVAAGIVIEMANRAPDGALHTSAVPVAAPAAPAVPDVGPVPEAQPAGTGPLEAARVYETAPRGAANRALPALDSHSVVVLAVPDPAADTRASDEFAECRSQVLERLRAVDGLNVISGERVAAFDAFKLQPEEIARELGAETVLVLKIMNHEPSCSATQIDARTSVERDSLMVFLGPDAQPDQWKSFAAAVAERVRDSTLTDAATLIGEAHAAVLNTALSAAERASALLELRRGSRWSPSAYDSAVVAAAAEIATRSADAGARESVWVAVRGIRDPYLVQPLLYSLANDAAEGVRRAAAFALASFVDEPGVRDALARAAAEDPSEYRVAACCIPTVREAARRALLSEQELLSAAIDTVLNPALTDRERLEPLVSSPDGRGLPVPLTNEAARAVFEIGRRTEDFVLRSRAWYVLGRTSPDAEFARAWIDDLERHPDENVRGAAAAGLAQHSGDAAVRAALERASVEDASQNVRRRALAALQGVNR